MDEKKYISGIYNYCDRWCERCAFTDRCRVYAADPSNMGDLPDDPDSPEFWDQLRNHFQDALEMLQQIAGNLESTDLGEDDVDDNTGDAENKLHGEKEDGPLVDVYSASVEDFFQTNEMYFSNIESVYSDKVKMGIPVDVEELGFLQEALKTIRWFQFFIFPKIKRAFSDFEEDPLVASDLQGDGNGSAKVVMIAIQRSYDAWFFVQRFFDAKKDEIEKILEILREMKSQVGTAFPQWQVFHRPGFDDEPETVVRLDFNPN